MSNSVEVVVSDIHVPYHDRRALNLTLDIIEKLRPNIVHVLGDLLDCYQSSRFLTDPTKRKASLAYELRLARGILDEIRQASPRGATLEVYGGNHEDRLRKAKWGKVPELADLPELTWPHLLQLRSGEKWHPYSEVVRRGKLWLHHGDVIRKHSGYTARALMVKTGGNVLCGHTHRLAHVYKTTWHGTFQGWENGCLCKLKPEYIIGPPDWQQGFSIIHFRNRGNFNVEQIHIHKGRAWRGTAEYKPTRRRKPH